MKDAKRVSPPDIRVICFFLVTWREGVLTRLFLQTAGIIVASRACQIETKKPMSGFRETETRIKKKKADVPGLCVKCSVCVCMLIQANTHLNVISSV